jgi:hypothetical protein
VLPGWEGSANDCTVLKDALQRPNGLKVPEGETYIDSRFFFQANQCLLDVAY